MSHPIYKHVGSPITRLIEECAELQQALCKAERFGWFNYHPDRPERTNMDDVRAEMDDVVEAIERMQEDMRQIRHEHFKASNAKLSGLEQRRASADCDRSRSNDGLERSGGKGEA